MTIEQYYRQLANGKLNGIADRLILGFLSLLSIPYGAVMRCRAWAYSSGILRINRLPCPVVSIGNITVGGTGKTPATAMIAKHFLSMGKRVAVLSRGYGGSAKGSIRVVSDGVQLLATAEEAGDEPYLLATEISGLIVVVGADRYRAGLLAAERYRPDIFLLDDGFQHIRLHRDLNILLLDSRCPFGNGLTFPAGLLREPKTAVNRADLVIMTRWDEQAPLPEVQQPICRAEHHLTGVVATTGGPVQPFNSLQGRIGLACAGIADPALFFAGLERQGLSLASTLSFPDHYDYAAEDIESIRRELVRCGADYLITTGKDWVKLSKGAERLGETYVASLEMKIIDREPLEAALDKLL